MLIATVLTAVAVAAPTTEPATNVTATGATLNGTVDESVTAYFDYGTTTVSPGCNSRSDATISMASE